MSSELSIFSNSMVSSPMDFVDSVMNSFAMQAEMVIASEIQKFKDKGTDIERIEICSVDGIYEEIESYLGIENHLAIANDVFIEDIFLEKFPSLNRRSAFVTIYSTYEVEFQKLCDRYQRTSLGGKLFKNYERTGFLKVDGFINKHFPELKKCPEQELITRLRLLRNQCVHYDARAFKNKRTKVKEVHQLMSEEPSLFHLGRKGSGEHVVFEKGSLEFTIAAFKAYLAVIEKAFQKRT